MPLPPSSFQCIEHCSHHVVVASIKMRALLLRVNVPSHLLVLDELLTSFEP